MGVKFDRILDGFDGPFEKVNGLQKPPRREGHAARRRPAVVLSHAANDAFIAVNRLLAAGRRGVVGDAGRGQGAFFIAGSAVDVERCREAGGGPRRQLRGAPPHAPAATR